MSPRPETTPRALRSVLEQAWSRDTSADPEGWSENNRPWGQCAVTALVLQDLFGGGLLRAKVDGISHYWNRLPSGEELDLTRDQFGPWPMIIAGEMRTRDYVLSFPDTVRRYELLKARVVDAFRPSAGHASITWR
jgi:hypothetical protein